MLFRPSRARWNGCRLVLDNSFPSVGASVMSSRPKEYRLSICGIGHPPKAVTMGELRGMRDDAI